MGIILLNFVMFVSLITLIAFFFIGVHGLVTSTTLKETLRPFVIIYITGLGIIINLPFYAQAIDSVFEYHDRLNNKRLIHKSGEMFHLKEGEVHTIILD